MTGDDRNGGSQRKDIKRGSIIGTRIRTDPPELPKGDASEYNGVSHFRFERDYQDISNGQFVLAEVIDVTKYIVYVDLIDIPSSSIEANVEYGSSAAVPVSDGYQMNIRLSEPAVMSGVADVKMTGIDNSICGKIISYHGSPPEVGKSLTAKLQRGRGPHNIYGPDKKYILRIAEDVIVDDQVNLVIEDVGTPSIARINSYHNNLPEIGKVIRAELSHGQGPHRAYCSDGGYEVEIGGEVLVSGEVEIEITEHALPMCGRIKSYCGNLPEIGDTIQTELNRGRGPHLVDASERGYEILVEDNVLTSGEVEIEIAEHGAPMRGYIKSYCGNLPEIGDAIRTELNCGRGPHWVDASKRGYEITVEGDVFASGEVEIEITEHGVPMRGCIKSHCENLPEIGDTIRANLTHGKGPIRADLQHDAYNLYVDGDVLVSGEVEIEVTEHDIPMRGRIKSYCGNLPEVGSIVSAEFSRGQGPQRVDSSDNKYEIQVDEDVLISGKAEIEVTQHGIPMRGQIRSYCGSLPRIGDTIRTEVTHGWGSQRVYSQNNQYEVQLDEKVLISGEAEIEITQHGLPMRGRIVSYCGNLPKAGDIKLVEVDKGKKSVLSADGNFRVRLNAEAEYTGVAKVEVTDISNTIRGDIVKYDSVVSGQDLSTYRSPWKPDSYVDNTDITGRKL